MTSVKETTPRFNQKASTNEEARQYYVNRAIYLLGEASLTGLLNRDWGVEACFKLRSGVIARSAYVLPQHQGKGHYTAWLASHEDKIISIRDCPEVWDYLTRHCVDRLVTPKLHEQLQYREEYQAVKNFYGDAQATRSGKYLINHIDEGLFVLRELYDDIDSVTMGAWCLHPLLQRDSDLRNLIEGPRKTTIYDDRFEDLDSPLCKVSCTEILLAMEYRRVANNYLLPHGSRKTKDIELSGFPEVNRMLVADKVQNRKDFENCLRGTVANAKELDGYFRAWLEALEISEETYKDLARKLQEQTGRQHAVQEIKAVESVRLDLKFPGKMLTLLKEVAIREDRSLDDLIESVVEEELKKSNMLT